jgi:hypothetical protein
MAEQTKRQDGPSTTADSIISKITVSSIGCKPGLVVALPDGELELPLCRIYGNLTSRKEQFDKDKGNTYVFFQGTFEAINMQSGEVFQSGKLFLPGGISQMVEDAVSKNPDSSIAFAFQLNAIKAKNPIGYSYRVLALKNPYVNDPLDEIRKLVAAAGSIEPRKLAAGARGPQTIDGNPQAAPAGAKRA